MEPEIYSQQNITSFLHPQNSHTWLPEINGKFYNIVTHLGLFRLASCLLWGSPFFSECLGFITTPSLQYLMLPNQTAENGQVVFSQEKAHKMVSIVKKEGAVNTIIAIPNAPKPNSRKWTSCFFTGKSTQNGVNCQKGRSCQLKRHKKRQSTRSKMPLQSLIFFFLVHALNLLWLKRKIRHCSQPICYVWLSDMEQL